MAKKSGKRIFDKQKIAEDWCFVCKDGGELMICDYGRCLKAYHPACVGKDDLDLASDKPWICGSHTCLVCKGSSDFHCYCCKRAACSRDIGLIDFVHVKGKYGFCNNCLKLALLVEEDRNVDSDGESVDLRDRDTYEGLFREYYEIVKEREEIDVNVLFAGKAQLDKVKNCQTSRNSGKENEQLCMDNGDFGDGEPPKKRLKKRRSTQQKTEEQTRVDSEKNVFVGWGSNALINFLQVIGQDTRKKLSRYDVLSVVCKYAKEHNLIDPVKRRSILCDVQLEAVFGEKVVEICRIFRLLKSHIVENEERLQKDEPDHDLAGDDTEMLVAPKTEKKVDQNNISSILYSTAAEDQVAALIPDNQMHQVSDETTPMKQNIPGSTPEKIDVGVIPEVVEVESLAKDEDEQNVFVGWGSKALIHFLQLNGQDTRKKLSGYDVLSVVCKYAKEHNLIDPVKRRKIFCDVQLEAVFGEKVVDICRMFRLLKSHIVENEERLQKDEPDHDLAGDDTEMWVAAKTEKKVDQNKRGTASVRR